MSLAEILAEYADRPLSPDDIAARVLRGEDPVQYQNVVTHMRLLAREDMAERYCTTPERCIEAIASPYAEVRAVGLRRVAELKRVR